MTQIKAINIRKQITNSKIRDIERLNSLIRTYATDLLAHITLDFMEDVEYQTSNKIDVAIRVPNRLTLKALNAARSS